MGAVLSIPRATGLPIPSLQVQTVYFFNVSGAGASVYPGVLVQGLIVLCPGLNVSSATGAEAFSTQGYMRTL
jgi:hypothetical protein